MGRQPSRSKTAKMDKMGRMVYPLKNGWDGLGKPGWKYEVSDCGSYMPTKPRGFTSEEMQEILSSQNLSTAKSALEHYNAKRRTKYELVDPVDSNGFLGIGGVWYHCNFRASQGSDESVLFFAELKVVADGSGGTKNAVRVCRPLTGAKTRTGCKKCGKMLHPIRGFQEGLYEPSSLVLRSRMPVKYP
ncbi:hypothetical protein vseg_005557 [Gypsophila vaccaria]